MPSAPSRPCARPGCQLLASVGHLCIKHAEAEKVQKKQYDRQRGSSAKRGYGRKWQNYRKIYLAEHPLCVRCEKKGRVVPATVVDHVKPHLGDYDLFWQASNHQSICVRCHNKLTAQHDGGFGNPIKPKK